MRPLRLGRSVWRLGSHHAAAYLLAGQDQAAIFEVGLAATAPVVLAQLDALGIERQEVRHLIISHAHADHASGQAALRAGLPRAVLAMSPGSRAFLEKPSTAQRFAADDLYTSGQVARRDGLEGPCPDCLPLLPPPLQDIQAGDVLDLGGLEVRFWAAPGHAPDGLICHLPGEGLVLAADSAGFCTKGRPGFPLHFVSYPQYMASLAAILALEPVALGLGHQDCFLGAAAGDYLRSTQEHLEKEHQGILKALAAGQDPEAVARGICQRFYHDELTVYPAESILNCARLLVRRSTEAGPVPGRA
jgi:glyoxylase-like metal-dependent hydrolase (beta-lactamase superfamily II)